MPNLSYYVNESLKKGISKDEILTELVNKGYSRSEIKKVLGTKDKNTDSSGYYEKVIGLFSSPIEFFNRVHESRIKNSLLLLLIISGIAAALRYGLNLLISSFNYIEWTSLIFGAHGFSLLFTFITFSLILPVIGSFIYAGISHGIIKIFHGKGNYVDSYNVVAYSYIPAIITSVIPLVGLLGIIYAIVLQVFGFSNYHEISKGRAVTAALMPLIITFVIFGLFIIWLIYALNGLF